MSQVWMHPTLRPALAWVSSLNVPKTNPCPTNGIGYKAIRLHTPTHAHLWYWHRYEVIMSYTCAGTYMSAKSGFALYMPTSKQWHGWPKSGSILHPHQYWLGCEVLMYLCMGARSGYSNSQPIAWVGPQWSGCTCSCAPILSTGMKCEYSPVPISR